MPNDYVNLSARLDNHNFRLNALSSTQANHERRTLEYLTVLQERLSALEATTEPLTPPRTPKPGEIWRHCSGVLLLVLKQSRTIANHQIRCMNASDYRTAEYTKANLEAYVGDFGC